MIDVMMQTPPINSGSVISGSSMSPAPFISNAISTIVAPTVTT